MERKGSGGGGEGVVIGRRGRGLGGWVSFSCQLLVLYAESGGPFRQKVNSE